MSETYDLFQQGREHLRRGMAAQATVSLEKAKRREPDKASIREALGIAYFRLRRYEEAESEFRAMLDISPADDYAHYGLARALEKLGRKDEASGPHEARELAAAPAARTTPSGPARSRVESGRPARRRGASARRRRGRRGDRGWVVRPARGSARGRRGGGGAPGRPDRPAADLRERRREVRPQPPRHRRRRTRRQPVHADCGHGKGNRPSFSQAAPPEEAERLYEEFCEALRSLGVPIEKGVFGARMEVELVNEGPVTIVLDVD